MTLAAATLGDRGAWGLGEAGPPPSHPPAALVCEVANRLASLLPVGPLFGLRACLAACGDRRSPPPSSVLPGDSPLDGAGQEQAFSLAPGGEIMRGREGQVC